MGIILPLLFIGGGLFVIFYLRPKSQNHLLEIQFMQTKSIAELKESFNMMDNEGLGDNYSEFVELKAKIVSDNLVEAPYSNNKVAFCDSAIYQVVETQEEYTDSNGNRRTRVNKREIKISDEKSSSEIFVNDGSTTENVGITVNGGGINLDIPKTFDRFEPKNNMGSYRRASSFISNYIGAVDTIGFKMVEKTIAKDQFLYIIGEAYRKGGQIFMKKPSDSKKPFMVTTKSEEELVSSEKQKALGYLIGGIVLIAIGVIIFFNK